MASLAMSSQKRSVAGVFVKSQICTKARSPPSTLSFAGQTAVVTGSNIGIGLEACRQMLDRGLTHLIMGVRSLDKGNAAASALRTSHPDAQVEVWHLDMTSYDTIRKFAQRCSSLPQLHAVILNAGAFNSEFRKSATGHEEMFQVNYLSTSLLSILIAPILGSKNQSSPGRLTIVGSSTSITNAFTQRNSASIISAIDDPKTFGNAPEQYATTKMCVLVLTHKLAEIVSPAAVIINCVDPGLVGGSALHRGFQGLASWAFSTAKSLSARSMKEGAWTYLDAMAVKGKETHGGFVVDWELHP